MSRPDYLNDYVFDWGLLDVVLGGKSALDSDFFIAPIIDGEQVDKFLRGYGLEPKDAVTRSEIFGNFQEAIQFIKRYFLKEGNPDGLELEIPHSFYLITEIGDIFFMATSNAANINKEDVLWAGIILKVMHTILHMDKDLLSTYFSTIQTQVFDRFYKYLHRKNDKLYIGDDDFSIPIIEFDPKPQKTRDSMIIKLLHKEENVAEQLFDRIGIRIVTENRFDALRVLKFLMRKYVIIPHNIKPSRSINTLIDTAKFKERHSKLLKMALRNELSEERLMQACERDAKECVVERDGQSHNMHTSKYYQSLQFTYRQLIKYKNPFWQSFSDLRQFAKENDSDSEITKRLMSLNVAPVAKEVKFFFPYEIQIADIEAHEQNTKGDASHHSYKRSQIRTAMQRLFKDLLAYKKMSMPEERL